MNNHLSHSILRLHEKITGRHILTRLEELNRTQWLSRAEGQELQQAKLQRLVEYAYKYVPFYRRTFDVLGFQPTDLLNDPNSFQKLPLTTKHIMREQTQDFLTTDPAHRKSMRKHATSGSTGEPFTYWEDYNQRDYVTSEILRHLSWSGYSLGEPHAYLWGIPLERSLRHRIRDWFMDVSLNRFYSNAYLLSDFNLLNLANRIRRYQPKLLFGYATALVYFARFVKEKHIKDIKLNAVYSAGEVLYPHYRNVLEEIFGCPIFDHYGTLECGGIASECEAHTGLHVNSEICFLEILKDGKLAVDDQPGEAVVTNLNNYGFPFIRYKIGDIVRMNTNECSCGRQSPMIQGVEGRTVDIFRTADGGAVWGDLEGTIFQVEGIRQSQVIQRDIDLIVIRIVKDKTFQESQLVKIERIIRKMMGEATRLEFEFPEFITPLKSGKYRYSFSEISTPDK